MRDLFLHFWYIPALFSTIYTTGSVWWTLAAERRFRKLREEQIVMKITYDRLYATVENVKGFLENDETLRRVAVIVPFALNRVR